MKVTVIIPTHNPDPTRFARTLAGLKEQTLVSRDWELLVVDNASAQPISLPFISAGHPMARVIVESTLGLSAARRAGIREARGDYLLFVDDDNVLAPDYLEKTIEGFARLPGVGALGGKSLPEFSSEPRAWQREFLPLLALRDLGDRELISDLSCSDGSTTCHYPPFAPIGAGMALRQAAAKIWMNQAQSSISDRRGAELSSGGDNDIVLVLLRSKWKVAYLPELRLTHLIPPFRLETPYLERLNHDIQRSWMRVLSLHQANPWAPIPAWSVRFRKMKAWLTYRAWRSPAAQIRWRGACGHFEGRAA